MVGFGSYADNSRIAALKCGRSQRGVLFGSPVPDLVLARSNQGPRDAYIHELTE